MQALKDGVPPTINGDGEQTRDFTYVDNAVQANVRAFFASETAVNQVYNVAYGDRISLNTLWEDLQQISGTTIKANYGPPRQGDVRDSLANIDKARKQIQYDPNYSVRDGLKLTWENFIQHG